MSAPQGAAGPAGHTSAPPRGAMAGQKFSAASKKDPALLPLAVIIGGAVCTAAYFFSSKATGNDPAKKFAPISNPWDKDHKEGSALYKYRYLGKGGKIEHHLPATSYETVPVAGNIDNLRAYNVPHSEDK